jgi:mannosyltransferase OCH1-like enzyme
MELKYKLIIFMLVIILLNIIFTKCLHKNKDIFQNNQQIQKKIFQISEPKYMANEKPYKKIIDKLKKQNPEYKYHLYDNDDMEKFVKFYYPKYWKTYKMIAPEYFVAKADYFRYMIIYHHGGVYFDLKSGSKLPLRDIIKSDDQMLVVKWRNEINGIIDKAINWCVIARKEHPILKLVLDKIHNKILNYDLKKDGVGQKGVVNLTGPKLLEKVVYKNIDKYNVTVYDNLIDNILVYNYLNKNFIDASLCRLYNITKGVIGRCTHITKRKRYTILTSPIIINQE